MARGDLVGPGIEVLLQADTTTGIAAGTCESEVLKASSALPAWSRYDASPVAR